jgi:deazaflavin-dependent oxidoreductase (nitroreductase family)
MSENQDPVAAMHAWNQTVIDEFRANDGVVGGDFAGMPILLLHTTGAKSGAERINPVAYLEDNGHLYVFASKAGAPTSPDWYHNLVAHPSVKVELGTESFNATAAPLESEERSRVYALQVAIRPGFGEYQEKTTRVIPVVELVRN